MKSKTFVIFFLLVISLPASSQVSYTNSGGKTIEEMLSRFNTTNVESKTLLFSERALFGKDSLEMAELATWLEHASEFDLSSMRSIAYVQFKTINLKTEDYKLIFALKGSSKDGFSWVIESACDCKTLPIKKSIIPPNSHETNFAGLNGIFKNSKTVNDFFATDSLNPCKSLLYEKLIKGELKEPLVLHQQIILHYNKYVFVVEKGDLSNWLISSFYTLSSNSNQLIHDLCKN